MQFDEVTKYRLDALEQYRAKYALKYVILFLIDATKLKATLQVGCNQSQIKDLQNYFVNFTENHQAIKLQICKRLSNKSIKDTNTTLSFINDPFPASNGKLIGAIFHPTSADKIDSISLKEFAFIIVSSRQLRMTTAVNAIIQNLHDTTDEKVYRSLTSIRNIVGANIVYVKDADRYDKWMKLSDTGELQTAKSVVIDKFEGSNFYKCWLKQPGYNFSQASFSRKSNFLQKLVQCEATSLLVVFEKSEEELYLQKSFSETETSIIRNVFGYMASYHTNLIAEKNRLTISAFFENRPSNREIDITEMFDLFQDLSRKILNVRVLNIVFSNGEISIIDEPSTTSFYSKNGKPIKFSNDYKMRLLNHHLSQFYKKWIPEQNNILIGIDIENDTYKIEFHLPNQDGKSKLYVVDLSGESISDSVLKSLIAFFNELHFRERTRTIDRAKNDYLTQVRHSLKHHFFAASKGITLMYPRWQKAVQNKVYWNNLHNDPIFKKQLRRTLWSLSQARMLTENGQFIADEIDARSINRKPYKFQEIIRDCLIMIDEERDRKGIRVTSRITGNVPSIMNGDARLMRIAMLNLIDNAIKYSINNGVVSWSLNYRGGSYKFSISNFGSQISQEMTNIITQMGNRGEQSNHLNPRHGTGLGLPIAIKILMAHHLTSKLKITSVKKSDDDYGGWLNTFSFSMPYLTGQSRAKAKDNKHV